MTLFTPTPTELIARARGDLRMGFPVLLLGAKPSLVLAAETLQAPRLRALCSMQQPVDLAITARRAQSLKLAAYDGDLARISLPTDADAAWVQAVADPAQDLTAPMKGPFAPRRGGDAAPHRAALALCKTAQLLPAALIAPLALDDLPAYITRLPLDGLDALLTQDVLLHPVAAARLPTAAHETGRLHIFRPADSGTEHYAMELGRPDRAAPVLVRLHSACFTGDVMGSLKCDCGPQLHAAMAQMGAEAGGVLLYLNQEGRGIGLVNKMRAYALQDQGFDTVEANHRLGFEDDERDFRIGAQILRKMGITQVRLMTNNPRKIAMMQDQGIDVVERVALRVGEGAHNRAYLATKAHKSGHLL
jgi:GTP cyclohydrolase II